MIFSERYWIGDGCKGGRGRRLRRDLIVIEGTKMERMVVNPETHVLESSFVVEVDRRRRLGSEGVGC